MAKSYTVISVDSVMQTMVVEYTTDGIVQALNIPVPAVGATVDDQARLYWPVVPDLSVGVTAASAAVGVSTAVAAPTLDDLKAAQIALLGVASDIQRSAGYTSDALGAVHTYASELADLTAMIASVTDANRTPPDWVASFGYVVGDSAMAGTTRLLCVAAGTSGTTAPTGAGVDGTATWASPWFTLFACTDGSDVTALLPHTGAQINQAGADGKNYIGAVALKLAALSGAVMAATTAGAVTTTTWSFP